MPLDRQRQLVAAHAAAVVDYNDRCLAAAAQTYRNIACASIDGIFDQLLDRCCWTLDDLAGGDLVDDRVRQAADW